MGGLFSVLHAQEYRFEIGGAGGGAFYMGDANKNTPFKGMNPAFGGIFRYNLNFRWAVKGNLMWGQVSGTTAGTGNALPENAQAAFKRNLFELGGQMEFNFFPYSDKFTYAYTKRFSPYVLLGLGATVAPGNGRTFAGVNLPVGLGVKYKIANRFNVAGELSIRKLFRDDLDVTDNSNAILDNPYQTGRNFLKNNDWYAFLLLSLTWDFGLRCSTCNNSDNIPGL
ncbi:MAG: outer membrane beta-barrel protein [Bacteroidales bacterium]